MAKTTFTTIVILLVMLTACSGNTQNPGEEVAAPGAPGKEPVWAFSGKTGIGTSYEAYMNKTYQKNKNTGEVSKVWFSIAQGVLTETMWGLIHEAQIKDMELIVVGDDFIDFETKDTTASVEYLSKDAHGNPNALAYKIVTSDKQGRYSIEKHIFTHPDKQALYVRIIFNISDRNDAGKIRLYAAINPHIANTGTGDMAAVNGRGFHAWEGDTHLSVVSSNGFENKTVGFVGVSDGIDDLRTKKNVIKRYQNTGVEPGNVLLLGAIPLKDGHAKTDIVFGFGNSQKMSLHAANTTLKEGYDKVFDQYVGKGDHIGWQDYLDRLHGLKKIKPTATDGGALLNVSALVLKAQEDKTHAGALIASLSNPWGDTVVANNASTGYKAVWPRDFYQCAMALMALGDDETPVVAFEYLKNVQVSNATPGNKGATGWFLQKTHVDGELEWMAVQLDQTAMPIMLGWKLWRHGLLNDEAVRFWYESMLKPAATFLVEGGAVNLGWNTMEIIPPFTQQERWEEQQGYSPSTTAATIAGLVVASDFALHADDSDAAKLFRETAIAYAKTIEDSMFTTQGKFNQGNSKNGNGEYFVRVTQNADPNDNRKLQDRNGRGELNEYEILDGGFLELVRYNVRAANDPFIVNSLQEYDDTSLPHDLRVRYEFTDGESHFPGWRRYGNDGYGEDAENGNNYGADGKMAAGQRGRVWPFFTGERGHYELAFALLAPLDQQDSLVHSIRRTYVSGMEFFANSGLMLPEQVWDGVGADTIHEFKMGEGTNSATPLAWTHAEYVKLVRSIHERKVWDSYDLVKQVLQ